MYYFTRLNWKIVVKYLLLFINKGRRKCGFINIGYGNIIAANRIICIISPGAAPTKRMIQEAKEHRLVIDATTGRKTRAVIVMDTGHIILSAVQPETVISRLDKDVMNKEDE